MIQIEISHRLLQDQIEQSNHANRWALLQQRREVQIQAELLERDAHLKALLQQAQLPRAAFVPAWQEMNHPMDRTLFALAAQNLILGAGVQGGGGGRDAKPQSQICYATKRASLPRTKIEGAKTA